MSHDKTLAKLIYMANQIATFFKSQPASEAVEGVATHINKFWEPRMRRQLFAHADGGGEGLADLVLQAMPLIRRPEEPAGTRIGLGAEAGQSAPGGKGAAAGEALSERSVR